ncbi:hypothetical protein [Psychrosphaera algicola]|uniref:Cxxc_20_cxxc protein n=1 Tax=Psychrosphaera algicola TaxID=3023714 RepID=A0ABT5FJK1_9GAMM|nr:hypothetical protein [Psychrosphaera sp. G1-22]MDC2891378.1 hypothetical protein [Psychrosphaera sp. G1-22]
MTNSKCPECSKNVGWNRLFLSSDMKLFSCKNCSALLKIKRKFSDRQIIYSALPFYVLATFNIVLEKSLFSLLLFIVVNIIWASLFIRFTTVEIANSVDANASSTLE